MKKKIEQPISTIDQISLDFQHVGLGITIQKEHGKGAEEQNEGVQKYKLVYLRRKTI